ncbi:MAG: septum formation initiator family protein [Hyphomonadaceae bacterium]
MSRNTFLFGLLVAVILVIGLYRAKDGARDSSADIVRLEQEIASAYQQKRLLEAELAHMGRREWIEEYARNELGMQPARANQFATEFNLDLLVGPVSAGNEIIPISELDDAVELDEANLIDQVGAQEP